MGPCYSHTDHDDAYTRITAITHAQAFNEIPSATEVKKLWQQAYARWRKLRKATRASTAT
jgi:hypothetical protein